MKRLLFFSLLCSLSLFTCGDDDPCEGIDCGIYGRCVNGVCECEPGYGGADCSTALMPTSMTVTNSELLSWPATDSNGAGWDLTTAPDVYMVVFDNDTNTELFRGNFFANATPPRSYSQNITIPDPGNELTFGLYDSDDFDADDYMGGIIVTLGEYGRNRGFPDIIDLDLSATNDLRIEISVEYEF